MREGIAGVGIDREDRTLPCGHVVGMRRRDPRPVALGRLDEHPLRAYLADHPADVPAQSLADLQLTVAIAEEAHVGDAEDLARRDLLRAPDAGNLRTRHVGVESARIAVGHDAVGDLGPLGDPRRHGACRAEIDVVRVGGDHEGPGGDLLGGCGAHGLLGVN